MRLLIITQAVDLDDPVLGFFHRWIEEFAKHSEKVSVICLKEGRHNLPQNVSVYSLGKSAQGRPVSGWEKFLSRISYVIRFYKYIWSLRREYDSVFVHMNPEYVVLGGLLWRVFRKKIVLWYVHRKRSVVLLVAALFAHSIVTAAPESFRIKSRKVHVLGHGIETAQFGEQPLPPRKIAGLRMVAVGRITPIKNLDVAIKALVLIREEGIDASLELIGEPATQADRSYLRSLEALIKELNAEKYVTFLGSIPNRAMASAFQRYDISINLCPTGGLDKAVIESMACGLPVITSNEAFTPYFGVYAGTLLCTYQDPRSVADRVMALCEESDLAPLHLFLRNTAKERFSVATLIAAIIKLWK